MKEERGWCITPRGKVKGTIGFPSNPFANLMLAKNDFLVSQQEDEEDGFPPREFIPPQIHRLITTAKPIPASHQERAWQKSTRDGGWYCSGLTPEQEEAAEWYRHCTTYVNKYTGQQDRYEASLHLELGVE